MRAQTKKLIPLGKAPHSRTQWFFILWKLTRGIASVGIVKKHTEFLNTDKT